MGTITIPHTFVDDVVTVTDDINENFSTFITEFNGLIEDANIKSGANISGLKLLSRSIQAGKLDSPFITETKLDYTLHKLLRHAYTGYRMAFGINDFTFISGSPSYADIPVTFSSDAISGDPGFTSAPRVVGGTLYPLTGAGVQAAYLKMHVAPTTTGVTFRLEMFGSLTDSGNIFWIALGPAA